MGARLQCNSIEKKLETRKCTLRINKSQIDDAVLKYHVAYAYINIGGMDVALFQQKRHDLFPLKNLIITNKISVYFKISRKVIKKFHAQTFSRTQKINRRAVKK